MKKKLCIMLAAACVGVGAVGFSACEDELKTFEYAKFENATYAYDGLEKALTVSGVPNGATVSYSADHTQTDVGEYPITATIECEGYETLTLSATLTITYSEAYYLQREINGLLAELEEEAAEEKAALEAKIAELKTSSEKTDEELEEAIADLEETHGKKIEDIETLIATINATDLTQSEDIKTLKEQVAELLQVEYHTVSFDANGGSAVASQTVQKFYKAEEPETPTKTECDFVGWYLGE